jgi:hypothetical protein
MSTIRFQRLNGRLLWKPPSECPSDATDEWLFMADPCPSLTADKQATGFRPAIDCKRADENTTAFFTYCGSARPIFHFSWHVLVARCHSS